MISTAKRPVPLEHYLYAGKELWKIVDASGSFLGQGYKSSRFSRITSGCSAFLLGGMCFPGIRMPVKRSGASKIRSAKLRAFLRYNDLVRAQQLRSGGPAGYPQVGVDRQLEEGVR